jgi:hypothetical protein
MGIIDPMAISNAAAIGGLEFGVGPVLWFLTVGLLITAAAAIGLSGVRFGSVARLNLPKLGHAQLASVGLSRSR